MERFSSRITSNPSICHGQATIRGLRYPVRMIADLLDGGMSDDEILADYPDLELEDLVAVREYSRRMRE